MRRKEKAKTADRRAGVCLGNPRRICHSGKVMIFGIVPLFIIALWGGIILWKIDWNAILLPLFGAAGK